MRKFFYLSAFAILTSFGYLVYGLFLSKVNPAILTLSTFACMLVSRFFQIRSPYLRNPLRNLDWFLPSHSVGVALCQFGYWYLFWLGCYTLFQGGYSGAAGFALAFLALNTIATPIARQLADFSGRRAIDVLSLAGSGFLLIVAIALIEINQPWPVVRRWIDSLDDELPSPYAPVALVGEHIPMLLAIFCFVAAVIFEAVGDFLGSRQHIHFSGIHSGRLSAIDAGIEAIHATNNAIAKYDLQRLIKIALAKSVARSELLEQELAQIQRAEQDRLSQLSPASSGRSKLEAELLTLRAAATVQLAAEKQREERLQQHFDLLTKNGNVDAHKLRCEIRDAHWNAIHEYIMLDDGSRLAERVKAKRDEIDQDLIPVVGLVLAIVFSIGAFRDATLLPWSVTIWYLAALLLLGFTGSLARPIFLAPMIKKDPFSVYFVPPVYAVRPLVFVLVGWLFLDAFGLRIALEPTGNLGRFAPVPIPFNDVLPKKLLTFWLGAAVGVVVALARVIATVRATSRS